LYIPAPDAATHASKANESKARPFIKESVAEARFEYIRSMRHARPLMVSLVTALALAACDDPPDETEAALRSAPPERTFQGMLAGNAVHLVLHDCSLYSVKAEGRRKIGWAKVLEPDPYPFFTFCERQKIWQEEGAVRVTLGRIAFGAGGCCATGGTWRSSDGREWTKER
jgi:hypothetical protein